jgi:Fur family ferric uptake transcriptional regulator
VSDPPDHCTPAPDWAQAALAQLATRGYRAGGARTAVIELLAEQGGCMDAEDVVEKLRGRGRTVGTASVYRALGLLSELGLLHKVALAGAPARFELVLPGGEHHHHLVCDRCGRTVAFSDERLEAAIRALSERTSFEVQAHDITLQGLCESCQRQG